MRLDGDIDWRGRRYWLVGCSEGLGRALAGIMSRAGVELVLSARSEARLEELRAGLPGKAQVVPVDVTDADSVERAGRAAGKLDGMVYLAGVWLPLRAAGWEPGRAARMLEVNLVGAARVLDQVMPGFVARGSGHLVLTGSLSAYRGMPGMIGYGASKAGMMSLAESLHAELRGTGVRVQLVSPGYIRTALTEHLHQRPRGEMTAAAAAQEFWEHMGTEGFVKSFPLGLAIASRCAMLMPQWLWERLAR